MSLKGATLFAIIGTALWSLRLVLQLINVVSGLAGGFVAANIVLISLVDFLAALSLLVFLVVFYNSKA